MRNLVMETEETTERPSKRSVFERKFRLLYVLSAVVIGLVVGICLTYSIMRSKPSTDPLSQAIGFSDTIEDIQNSLLKNVDSNRIGVWLKTLTEKPFTNEQDVDDNTLFVYNKWTQLGLNTSFSNYTVLLSFQNISKPNSVSKYNKSGGIIHITKPFEDPLNATPEEAQYYKQNPPFLAYSASTDKPLKGTPVYVNYGRAEDYQYLSKIGISVSGHIVIARYGMIFRANIVRMAEEKGAIGVVIYSDPYDYTDGNVDNTYPKSVYLPETGVQRGTAQVGDGDPQTPFYPSIKSAYKLPINETDIPRIPVQPISYGDAKHILDGLKGPKAPADWTGAMNITYNIGPEYVDDSYLTLEVNTYLKQKTIYNIIGIINGCTEPDRYVIVGNHRDAWTFGAADPLSGTAALIEMSEAFTSVMTSQNWCPRRSIVFCSWAAEEPGLIGSTEWIEENQKLLERQAIAYLNVDIAIKGNVTFHANAVPLLYSTILMATKSVPNPNQNEVKDGIKTVYDSYVKHRPFTKDTDLRPDIGPPGSGSDHTHFLQGIGVPVVDFIYDCEKTHIKCYALYHTMYETFEMIANLTDRGFKYSKALTQVWAEMVRSLSDTPLLPFSQSLQYYPQFLRNAFKDLKNTTQSVFTENNISLDFLEESINEFISGINDFMDELKQIDQQNPLTLRRVNDILMSIERAFIEGNGLPFRKDYRHILLSPSTYDSYSGSSFTGVYDLLFKYNYESNESIKAKVLTQIREHLSVIVFHINSAKHLVKQSLV